MQPLVAVTAAAYRKIVISIKHCVLCRFTRLVSSVPSMEWQQRHAWQIPIVNRLHSRSCAT